MMSGVVINFAAPTFFCIFADSMYGVNAKLGKKYFKCTMCKNQTTQEQYIYNTFPVDDCPIKEMLICGKCAKRECKNLNNVIDERTKEWQKRQSKKLQ